MPSAELAVVGNLLLDELPDGSVQPGGAALYTALAARSHGISVTVFSVVGPDYPLELLEEAGVRLQVRRLKGPSGRTTISYGPTGRSLIHSGPPHVELCPEPPAPNSYRLLHIAPMPTAVQLRHLQSCRRGAALLDPYPRFDPAYRSALGAQRAALHTLLLNLEELDVALDLPGWECAVLVKEGADGGRLLGGARWAARPCTVLDPTGAGDSFAGGYAAGLILGEAVEKAVARGARTAEVALRAVGPQGFEPSGFRRNRAE